MERLKLKRWRYRSTTFKVGFCGVLLATVLCCLGLVVPAWQNTGGLWIYSTIKLPVPDWFQVVRAMEMLCVALLIISIAVETFQDVCARSLPSRDSCAVEMLSAFAGIFGVIGVVVFAVAVHQYPSGEGPYGPCRVTLFWGWGLQVVGSLLAMVSAALLGWSRATYRHNAARSMQVDAFRKTAAVYLNPYFVSRSVPSVKILPVLPKHGDSQA